MNLTLTSLNTAASARNALSSTSAAASASPTAAAPAASDAANAAAPVQEIGAVPQVADAAQAPAQPALAFAQWLGLDASLPAVETAPALPEVALPETETKTDEQQPATDNMLLGAMAMAMPLMPAAQATLAAVVAALPGAPAAKEAAPAAETDVAPAGAGDVAGKFATSTAAAPTLPSALPSLPAATTAATAAAAPTASDATGASFAGDLRAAGEASQEQAGAAPTERAAMPGFGVTAPTSGNQRTTDTVALSGPPTAWRQTLQEALGDRLQLQVGKGAEQAVIRLEPPMLGRVEIAIRHTAGALEVHISATHGEVLRQLQSVSENLRNDLAQRQFTDVAVNIAPAPRSANATPQFAGDGGNRGRQQDGREQEQTPGNALAEANTGASSFSLNGRA